MRIVQLANFYGPRSGGLRTALNHLGAGYAALGHEVVLIVPGARATDEVDHHGIRRVTLRAAKVPGTGGYRAVDAWQVKRLLERLHPDRLEVSDRLTLRGMGMWARRRGIPNVVISHERLDRLIEHILIPPRLARPLANLANRRMAERYDTVVCTTAFAMREFERIDARNVVRVPLGVDLDTFRPDRFDDQLRERLAGGAQILMVHCGRLSPEKHVERSIDTVSRLRAAGCSVRLVVAGDGPRRESLEQRARGLPVEFLGFLGGRDEVARLLASADISLAPGPHETFGLAALEALASGTPVVVSRSSALSEIVQPSCGAAVADNAPAFAAAVGELLEIPRGQRREASRARAEQYPWPITIGRMLSALRVPPRL